jgi:hypothetical protein
MKEWGRVKGRVLVLRAVGIEVGARVVSAAVSRRCDVWLCAPGCRGRVFLSTDPLGVRVRWGGQARLPRHVFALVHAHDGIVGHGQVGLNQLDDRAAR